MSQKREENENVRAYLDADDRALHEALAKAVVEPEIDESESKSSSADSECQTNADDFEQAKRVLRWWCANTRNGYR